MAIARSGLATGQDIGVEGVGFVPPGFAGGGAAYFADRATSGNPHPGTDSLLRLDAGSLRVEPAEMARAHAAAEPAFLEAVRRVRQNVLAFQSGLLHRSAVLTVAGRHELRLRYRPVRRVGVLVPGGAASYPSTLLMTVCPAQAAGVPEIVVVMPPTPTGGYSDDQLAVCKELGVSEVYRIGGAQAIAALLRL